MFLLPQILGEGMTCQHLSLRSTEAWKDNHCQYQKWKFDQKNIHRNPQAEIQIERGEIHVRQIRIQI